MNYSELTDDELYEINTNSLTKFELKDLIKERFKRKVNSFVQHIETVYDPVTISELPPELYLYKDGYYHSLGKNILQQMCNDEFQDANTPSLFKEIFHKIESYQMIERGDFLEPVNKINLLNGILNVYTRELEPHSSEYNFLYKLNINYNPNAKCPNIEKFLRDICSNDDEKLYCIIEFLGFCLISSYPIKKFLMILGRGDNGKSTLEYLIRAFFGNEKNVTGLTIQDICDSRFLASRLYGKRLNIRGEMKQLKLESIEMLKSLTGGDIVSVDRKHKDMIDLYPSCKFIFHFNKLPIVDFGNIDNQSWKRMLLIELTNKFTGKSDDKNIRNNLIATEELEGLLNLALIGLNRLRKNKHFTYNDELTHDKWMDYVEADQENPLTDFVEDYLNIGELNSYISQTTLYEIYLNSKYSKLLMLSKNMFTRLITAFPGISVAKKGNRAKRYKTYENVKLRSPSKEPDIVNESEKSNESKKPNLSKEDISKYRKLIHIFIDTSSTNIFENFWLAELKKLNLNENDSKILDEILALKNEISELSKLSYNKYMKEDFINNLLKKNWKQFFNKDIIKNYYDYTKTEQIKESEIKTDIDSEILCTECENELEYLAERCMYCNTKFNWE